MFLNHMAIQWISVWHIFSYTIKDQINQRRNKLTRIDFIGIDLQQFGIVGELKYRKIVLWVCALARE